MTELKIKSNRTKYWTLYFPTAFPVQLTGRCAPEAWVAFIKEINDLGTASVERADALYPWWTKQGRITALFTIALLCLLLIWFIPCALLVLIYTCIIESKEHRITKTERDQYNSDSYALLKKWNESEAFRRGVISVDWGQDTQLYTTVAGSQGYVSSRVNRETTWYLVVGLGPLPVAAAVAPASKQVIVKFGGATQALAVDQRMTGADITSVLPMLFGNDENLKTGGPRSLTLVGKGLLLPSTVISDVLGSDSSGTIVVG